MDSRQEREENGRHSPEPWRQEGRYIRDAEGEIVVRGKSIADARRIVAAINATREIPTEALECWFPQDVSDAKTRPDLEIEVEEHGPPSPLQVLPPAPPSFDEVAEKPSTPEDFGLIFDRRVFQRRVSHRRVSADRRQGDRRRGSAAAPSLGRT